MNLATMQSLEPKRDVQSGRGAIAPFRKHGQGRPQIDSEKGGRTFKYHPCGKKKRPATK